MVVTNLWPSARRPAWGTFVANRVEALRRAGHQVEVVAVRDHGLPPLRYAGLVARAVGSAVRSGPPAIVEAHIAYPTGALAYPLARRFGAPLVLFAHGSDVLRLPDRSGPDRRLARAVFDRAGLVVANSDYLAAEVGSRLGVPARRLAVVPPGIRYDALAGAAAEPGSGPGTVPGPRRRGLLVVGHLIRRKGVDVLIEALALLQRRGEPPFEVRVVGDGPERLALEVAARSAGVPVRFTGAGDQAAVARAMASSQILVAASREEALGLVALEAMAAGAVPVVSGIGGLAETVTEGVTGFTCRPEDPADLADALLRAREAVADPERRQALVEAGEKVARSHDVDGAVAQTVRLYRDLVSGRAAPQAAAREAR